MEWKMKYNFHTTKQRHDQMAKVHVTGGKDEVILRKLLWHRGVRYRTNYKKLPGKPDIAITKYKIAIFIDGEFWHGFDWENYQKHIKSNRDYWIPKIEANMRHDREVTQQLEAMGWIVLRFWSKQVLKNPDYFVELILWYLRGQAQPDDRFVPHS